MRHNQASAIAECYSALVNSVFFTNKFNFFGLNLKVY